MGLPTLLPRQVVKLVKVRWWRRWPWSRVRCWVLRRHEYIGSIPPGYWYADSAYCKWCGAEQGVDE